jgi:hypothetical protein
MSALANDTATKSRDGIDFVFPVAGGEQIFAGSIVAINSTGYACSGKASGTMKGVGIAQKPVDNRLGNDGDLCVEVKRGCFLIDCDSSISNLSHIGITCFLLDDHTVTLTASENPAGTIRDVIESGEVWVEF